MKLYLAGPMTGKPELNYPAFHAESARLRALGHKVVNPAELSPPATSWNDAMRRDIAEMVTCDAVVVLDGWIRSRGAMIEVRLAQALDMEVFRSSTVGTPTEWRECVGPLL